MTSSVLAADFALLASGAVWIVLTVMCFWIWERSKAATNWLTLIGAIGTAGYMVLRGLGIDFEGMGWFSVIGAVLVTVGYYLSVKPTIDARLTEIQTKKKAAASAAAALPPIPPPPTRRA